jgi:hypothetical protein
MLNNKKIFSDYNQMYFDNGKITTSGLVKEGSQLMKDSIMTQATNEGKENEKDKKD